MKDKILQAAERRVRCVGFSEMSFRDLASDVGIKSASVHYHFPTKADLGEALVARYAERFKAELEMIDTDNLRTALDAYVALYSRALVLNESICLCAIMGAEAIGLPDNVNARTTAFFEMNLVWLAAMMRAHGDSHAEGNANLILAALEGGMIVASASKNRTIFEEVAKNTLRTVMQSLHPKPQEFARI